MYINFIIYLKDSQHQQRLAIHQQNEIESLVFLFCCFFFIFLVLLGGGGDGAFSSSLLSSEEELGSAALVVFRPDGRSFRPRLNLVIVFEDCTGTLFHVGDGLGKIFVARRLSRFLFSILFQPVAQVGWRPRGTVVISSLLGVAAFIFAGIRVRWEIRVSFIVITWVCRKHFSSSVGKHFVQCSCKLVIWKRII